MMRVLQTVFVWIVPALLVVGFFLLGETALAQELDTGIGVVGDASGLGGGDPRVIIGRIINVLLGFLGILAVVIMLYAGVIWMTAGGRDEPVKKAQRMLINAGIGLVIILSAMAITSFVISRLAEATGGSTSGSFSDDGGGPPPGFGGSGFDFLGGSPVGVVPIRNVVVAMTFSSNVDSSSVDTNVTIREVGSDVDVEGSLSTLGSIVRFVPSAACPAPNETESCFDANTTFEVIIGGGLRGTNDAFVDCAFSGCRFEFTTGELVDVTDPIVEITYPDNGDSLSLNADIPVQITVTDDAGVAFVEGFADDELIGTDTPTSTVTSFVGSVSWDTTGLVPGSRHTLDAFGSDIAGHRAGADDVRVVVRPAHCFNGVLDADVGETDIDCGGDPASEDYCGACDGSACSVDDDCSTGFCVDNICVRLPHIISVTPNDGAVGNYITLEGEAFGASPGSVTFLGTDDDGTDDVVAGLACRDGWSRSEVVIEVPVGALDGPLMLTTSSGRTDTTSDGVGASLPDFDVNATARPGLCSLSPNDGRTGDEVTLTGAGFGTADPSSIVYFHETPAGAITDWATDEIGAVVPPISVGPLYVTVDADGELSNPKRFNVLATAVDSVPVISYVDPAEAPIGQTITIFGSGFGSLQGTVRFVDPFTGYEAVGDNTFPAACLESSWTTTSITVKVPEEYQNEDPTALRDHNMRVVRADGTESEPVGFEIVSGDPGPGICAIVPILGPTGTSVTLHGEGFGSTTGSVAFSSAVDATVSSWGDDEIDTVVPSAAITGPVSLVTLDGAPSNAVNFEVGSCDPSDAAACGAGFQCCPETLACIPASLACDTTPDPSNYLFTFSTGEIPIPPEVLQVCQGLDSTVAPTISPTPWSGRVGGNDVCVNALIGATFTVPVESLSGSVTVEECTGSGDNPCASRLNVTDATGFTYNADNFSYAHPSNFSPDTTYVVTISDAVTAVTGGAQLVEPYVFGFTTRDDPNACDFEDVLVVPGVSTLTEQGDGVISDPEAGDVQLTASGVGDDACVLLNAFGETINWTLEDNASLSGAAASYTPTSGTQTLVTAQGETVSGGPVSAIATFVEQGLSALGLVRINFTEPRVVSHWPNCSVACLEASIGARFNTEMSSATLSTSNVILEACANELCDVGNTNVPIATSLNVAGDEVYLEPVTPFSAADAGTYYRATITDGAQSVFGVPLGNLNYGDAYSWIFRLDPAGTSCTIDHVDVTPDEVLLRAIGQRQGYDVTAYGAPDSCSEAGQRLNSSLLDWSWSSSDPNVATLLGGGSFDYAIDPAPGCTSVCTRMGSQGGVTMCGNGGACSVDADCAAGASCVNGSCIEHGEECDFGDEVDGDGCSSSCLWEGSEVTCGDGDIDAFEHCDDGNTEDGDGCSSICLNEGSRSVGAICGNGSLAYNNGGESCDDGNGRSGDGCSSDCLWEGSLSGLLAVCGDSVLDAGEDCDDGNLVDGDGCSATCLFEGGNACSDPTDPSCCGNGVVESGNYEQCDGGEGCSSTCRLLGSSIHYSTPSFCGDGVLGIGEAPAISTSPACDGTSVAFGDGRVDARQYAEVAASVPSTPTTIEGYHVTNIEANELSTSEDDRALLNVSCSCEASNQCPGNGTTHGCGQATQCCYARPTAPTVEPNGSDECRNTAIRVRFSDLMAENSFEQDGTPNIALRINLGTGESCPDDYLFARRPLDLPMVPRAIDGAIDRMWSFFRPSVHALTPGACYVPTELIAQEVGEVTEVILQYDALLDENQSYTVEVYGDTNLQNATEMGVLTRDGIALDGTGSPTTGLAASGTFTTGDDVCQLDRLEVIDTSETPGLFLAADTSHAVEAVPYASRSGVPEEIQEVPGVYEWETDWAVSDTTIVTYADTDPSTEETGSIESGQQIGRTTVTASSEVTVDTLFDTVGDVVDGSLSVQVFLCEAPWPNLASTPEFDAPLLDSKGNGILTAPSGGDWSHFSTMYCRAAVLDPDGSLPDTALPDFLITQVDAPAPDVMREMFFRHPTRSEAIGVRVLSNEGVDVTLDRDYDDLGDIPSHLPIDLWYQAQGFAGAPAPVEVGGYRSLRDGRTTYVGGLTMNGSGRLQPAVFAISYTEGAGPETVEVYNQIVQNFRLLQGTGSIYEVSDTRLCRIGASFALIDGEHVSCDRNATCVAETGNASAWCDANLTKIQRDQTRLEDLRRIELAIDAYGDTHKHCSVTTDLVCQSDSQCPGTETCRPGVPLLDAGSFLRGWSTSAWPSWASELGNTVGTALPVDPLNTYAGCPDGYDDATCWNGTDARYMCPRGSNVYHYQRRGIENYTLSVDFEWAQETWAEPIWAIGENQDPGIDRLNIGRSRVAYPWHWLFNQYQCTGAVLGDSVVCGDGVIGGGEACEIGQTSVASCTAADGEPGLQTSVCAVSCDEFVADPSAECIAVGCGNGVVEGACLGSTDPALEGMLCVSDASCGDGECDFTTASAEECDDGELNGTYGFCSNSCHYADSISCGNGIVEGPEICDEGSDNGDYDDWGTGCSWDCASVGPHCGDGIRQFGYEQCDTEFETWAGSLCLVTLEPCTTNSDCDTSNPADVCGGGMPAISACQPQGFCVGGANDGLTCDSLTGFVTGHGPAGHCSDSDLDGNVGTCTVFDTFRSRGCNMTWSSSCTWNSWSNCQQQGSCGNGVIDGGEECDDGNTDNNDSCTNICQANVCGDGFINPSVESCDLGSNNGNTCSPTYGGTCNYCTTSCTYQTVSGAYCGDGVVNIEAGEMCDSSPPRYGMNAPSPGVVEIGSLCGPGQTFDSNGWPCTFMGACNGGTNNGEVCSVAASLFVSNGCLTNNDGGACRTQVCDATCENACPFNYQSVYLLAQEWHNGAPLPGANFDDSVELFSYQTNGTCFDTSNLEYTTVTCQTDAHCGAGEVCEFLNAPDEAMLSFPACRVGDQIMADVTYDIEWPELDVVFVLDYSSSMNNELGPNGETRWELMELALEDAIDTLHEQYPGVVRAGTVTFGGWRLDGPDRIDSGTLNNSLDFDPDWAGNWSDPIVRNSCPGEAYWNDTSRSYGFPDNWWDIDPNASGDTHTQTAACIDYLPTTSEQDFLDFAIPPAPTAGETGGNGTQQAAGLLRAREVLLQYPSDHEKVVILMSDGSPSCRGLTDKYDPACTVVANAIYDASVLLRGDGVDVYSALFSGTNYDQGKHRERSFHIYSSDCQNQPGRYEFLTGSSAAPALISLPDFYGIDTSNPYDDADGVYHYARYNTCTDNPIYSYTGHQENAFDEMFQKIIDNVVNARIYIGEGVDQVTSIVNAGPAVPIPLPENFRCFTGGPTTEPIRLQFGGIGTVTLDNFQFFHCPVN